MTLGETIRSKRESLGMTQQDLAAVLFVTRQTVSRWESGSRCPDLIMSKKIADVFDITLDDLVSDNDVADYVPPNNASSDTKKMLAAIFLLVLGVWFMVFSLGSDTLFFGIMAMVLPFLAAGMFIIGYFNDTDKLN